MNIWNQHSVFYDKQNVRRGLRLKFDNNVDSEVRRAIKNFAVWLRKEYRFPVRVPVYVKSSMKIKAMDKDMVVGTCFCPYNRTEEPYIRIVAGDYADLCISKGKDNALASILHSLSHEITHYYQWIHQSEQTKIQSERQAEYFAHRILLKYATTREHP